MYLKILKKSPDGGVDDSPFRLEAERGLRRGGKRGDGRRFAR